MSDERFIQAFFDEVEASPGIYDGLREIGEGSNITPQERLHEMFLKRLYGHKIRLSLYDVKTFGDVEFEEPIVFDYEELEKNGFTSTIPYTSSTGSKGVVKLDWAKKYLTFVPDDRPADDPMDAFFIYRVGQFRLSNVVSITSTMLDLGLLMDAYSILDLNKENDTLALSLDNETNDYIHAKPDFHVNDMYIGGGVLAQKGQGFVPERPATFKEISDVTGVSASTLSDLKNGKKQLRNLTVETASLLSAYGHIKFFDSMIRDGLRLYDKNRKRRNSDYEHILFIDMMNGDRYIMNFDSQDDMVELMNQIQTVTDKSYVMLRSPYKHFMYSFQQYGDVVIRKDEVRELRTVIRKKGESLDRVYHLVVTMRDGSTHKMKFTDMESMSEQYDMLVGYMRGNYSDDEVLSKGLDSMTSVDGTILLSLRGSDISSVAVEQVFWD